MSIQSILDSKGATVFTVRATETIKGAADLMRLHAIAALVVKSGDAVTGLISDRDILYAISRHGEAALSMSVSDFASHDKIAVSPDDSLNRALSLMRNHHVRHLLVMTDGRLVGIVSIGDVVKIRLENLETETNVLRDAYIAAH